MGWGVGSRVGSGVGRGVGSLVGSLVGAGVGGLVVGRGVGSRVDGGMGGAPPSQRQIDQLFPVSPQLIEFAFWQSLAPSSHAPTHASPARAHHAPHDSLPLAPRFAVASQTAGVSTHTSSFAIRSRSGVQRVTDGVGSDVGSGVGLRCVLAKSGVI